MSSATIVAHKNVFSSIAAFSVMTTIGYGNVSPESVGGRALVFTMGFISIILFAAASARAACVITSVLDKFLVKMRLTVLTRPWTQLILWGSFYFIWLVLIALVYNQWRVERLGEAAAIPFTSAYWFSFISTTTVGFGDYYLEPEVIVGVDCLLFPIIFLLGFSTLASFLTTFSRLVRKMFHIEISPRRSSRRVEELREERLGG